MSEKLKPIIFKDEYFLSIQKKLEYYFFSMIFKRLFDYLKSETDIVIKNSKATSLISALNDGRVRYIDGAFVGKFNSKISKDIIEIGGVYRKSLKGYRIDQSKLPVEVLSASATGEVKIETVKKKTVEILDTTSKDIRDISYKMDFSDDLKKSLESVEGEYKKTLASVAVGKQVTKGVTDALIKEYNTNMNLYIKNWNEDAIERLRERVTKNVYAGMRADKLEKVLMSEYDITKKKASFLARQETSLMVSKYKEERYKDAGINKYRWSTSRDSRVRDRHKKLNGKIFSFDNPPIVDEKTGRRANPGEDYFCRCVAVPVI